MKKPTLLLLIGILAGAAGAALGPNLLTNGGFQAGATGWAKWWDSNNAGLPVMDPIEGDLCAGVWWNDCGIYQTVGPLEAGTYEVAGKLMARNGLTSQRVVLKAEGTGAAVELDLRPGDPESAWQSLSTQITLPSSTTVTINLMLVNDLGSGPSGVGLFDDISLCRVTPDEGRRYYGAPLEPRDRVMHTAGQNVGDFNAYWTLMDPAEKPACYMTYCNLVTPFVPALREDLERYRRDTGVYLPVQLGLYIVGSEHEIAAGLWDADIERFCKDLNRLGYPLYIRIGYECNGAHNNYDPTAYKAAFIRITNALRAHNVEAATVFNVIQGPWAAWYPGDAYVDWMSINAFSVWNIQHPDTPAFLADAHARGKPVMIGEAGPTWWHTDQGQASWDGYFVPYFSLIENWPGIKNFCYINANWGGDWGDCRLQPYPIVAGHYKEEMDSPLYLHGMNEPALRAEITEVTDTQPPGPVSNITANTTGVPAALTWNAAADDTGINRYEILRDGELAGYNTTEHFVDTTAVAGTTYMYTITAIDRGGNRSPASGPFMVVTAPAVERVINGEFDEGRGPWATSWNAAGLSMTSSIDTTSRLSGANSLKLDITQVTGTNWHLQHGQAFRTQAGFTYTLTFRAVADRSTSLPVILQETHSPYSSFIAQTVNLTTTPQTFTFTGVAPDDDTVNLSLLLGGSAPRTIWIDAVSVTETSNAPDPHTCADVIAGGFALSADLSGDCAVNLDDLVLLAEDWLGADMTDLAAMGLQWLTCNDPQDGSCRPTW